VDDLEVEEKEGGHKQSDRNGNPRKLAGREQCYLTSDEREMPGEARVGKSLHQRGVAAGRVLSIELSVFSGEKRDWGTEGTETEKRN